MKVWITDEEFNSHELEKALIQSKVPGAVIVETGYDFTLLLARNEKSSSHPGAEHNRDDCQED